MPDFLAAKKTSYLNAMGITLWSLRQPQKSKINPEHPTAKTRSSPLSSEPTQSLERANTSAKQNPARPHAQPKIALPAVANRTIPAKGVLPDTNKRLIARVQIRFFVISIEQEGLIIGELPYSGDQSFGKRHNNLLEDILRSLQIKPSQPLQPSEFIWPINSFTEPFGDLGCRDAFTGFLENQFGFEEKSWLMILGQKVPTYVLGEDFILDPSRGQYQWREKKVFILYSITEMMRIATIKKESWRLLTQT